MRPASSVFAPLLALMLGFALTSSAAAGPDFDMPEPEVSLVSGGAAPDGRYLAALRIDLPEGWKTYWRSPGDSGIPPSFDWSGSRNLGSVEVAWPAPELFDDGYGWIVGYEHRLVLPLLVTPARAGEAVRLDLALGYAFCKDICVPAEAALAQDLPGDAAARGEIEDALARVPAPVEGGGEYGVVSGEVVSRDDASVLRLSARFPDGASGRRLLVEGPEDWYLPVPEAIGEAGPGVVAFELELPRDADPAAAIFTVTGLSTAFSFEQPFRLD